MNICINGSRSFNDSDFMVDKLNWLMDNNYLPHESNWVFILGGAVGADTLASELAVENNIPYIMKKANWEKYGKSAGYIRNNDMLNISDALVSFWDGESKGTIHMVNISNQAGIPVYLFNTKLNKTVIYKNGIEVWSDYD
ncbi:MAG: SLOG family protein [Dolichospermum sp.]